MNNNEDILSQYLHFATDVNRNLSNIIHLTNNLRYNTFQLFNNYTNSTQLTNDIFFPPIPPPPINAPPSYRRARRRRPLRSRLVPQESGLPPPPRLRAYFNPSPTETQISGATESALYADISTNYMMCPIDQQNFVGEDRILRIRHCEHVFRETALRQWFRTSSECPVCRYDIRYHNTTREVVTPQIDSSSNPLLVDISNNFPSFAYSLTVNRFMT